jgi:hypothetical protein
MTMSQAMHAMTRQAAIEHEIKADAIADAREELRLVAMRCLGRAELLTLFVLSGYSVEEMSEALDQLDRPN